MENAYNNGGWTVEEMKRLFKLCEDAGRLGKGLKSAFDAVAAETGRKPNSVRNYYYAQVKTLSLLPEFSRQLGINLRTATKDAFVLFGSDEIRNLTREILTRQGGGESVRAITADMSGGDKRLMLRLQNKYRSTVAHKKPLVTEIMRTLRAEKKTYFNPYTKTVAAGGTENGDTNAADNINALFRRFFDAKNERDKIDSLGRYMSELAKVLARIN
jgi:hypothetical protein